MLLYKEDWEEAKERLKAWWNEEALDGPVVQVSAPRRGLLAISWDRWSFVRYPEDPTIGIRGFERACEGTYFAGEAFPNLHINLGPGVMAAYLGASPRFISETVWFETPKPWEELESLELDRANPWWERTKRIASMALEASKDKFIVGMTDLGGIMDIAASLRGSNNLIIDLFKHPRRVKELCWQILELWHSCYEELHTLLRKGMEGSSAWMAIWCQERWYPIQCDLSAVLSPRLFEAFALPLLREQCKRLDHTIYHWDGPGQIVHLDSLLSIKELDGIQWTPGAGQPGTSSPVWFPLYRKIQRKNKRLVLLGVDKESLDFLLKELSPRGLLIQTNCTTEDEARELMKRIGRS